MKALLNVVIVYNTYKQSNPELEIVFHNQKKKKNQSL